jgi:hypothetical protein
MEEEIISVTIDNASAIKKIEEQTEVLRQVNEQTKQLTEQNKALTKANKTLADEFKTGKITQQQFNAAVAENNAQITQNSTKIALNKKETSDLTSTRKNLIKSLDVEKGSLEDMRAELSRLTSARNKINISTEEGRKKFDAYNKTIKTQNDAILDLEKAGGSYQRQVGNYEKGLNSVNPAIGSFISGIKASTTAALAFIATPLGAVLAALGLALAAVAQYFTRTEEGAEKLRIITATLTVAFQKFLDIVASIGGVIVKAFEDPQQAIKDFSNLVKENISDRIEALFDVFGLLGEAVKKAFEGDFEGALESASKAGKKYITEVDLIGSAVAGATKIVGEMSDEILESAKNTSTLERALINLEKKENDLILTRAKANSIVKEQNKIAEDLTKSLEEREAAALKAIEADNLVLQQELQIARERERIIKAQNEQTNSLEADRKREIEAEAKVFELRTRSAELQTTLQNKLNTIRAQDAAQKKKISDEETARLEKEAAQLEANAELEAQRIEKEKQTLFELELFKKELAAQAIEDEIIRADAYVEIERFKLERILQNEELTNAQILLAKTKAAAAEKSIEDSKLAITKKREEEKQAVQLQTVNAVSGFLNEAFGNFKPIAIATATIDGILAAQKALAQGGIFGAIAAATIGVSTAKNISSIKNTKPASGGASPSTPSSANSLINQSNQTNRVTESIENAPRPVVSVEEITLRQRQVAEIKETARA